MKYFCICCGTCCRKFQPWLTLRETQAIAGRLNIEPDRFIAEYTDRRWPGTESFLLVHTDGACVFLSVQPETGLQLCRIHDFKPDCCRAWAAGLHKAECQQGLKTLFGISVDTNAHMQADEDQLQRLQARYQVIDGLQY
jgi:Fe-S-cluster containining protein